MTNGVKILVLNVIMNGNLQSVKITAGERNPMTLCWHTHEMLNCYCHPISSGDNDKASINTCQACTDLIRIMEKMSLSKMCHKTIINQARLQFSVWPWKDLFHWAQMGVVYGLITLGKVNALHFTRDQ